MLGHPDRDLRQLLDLMARWLTRGDQLGLGEHPATPAPRRPVLDELVDRPRRQQLTTVPLMTRLAAAPYPSGPAGAVAKVHLADPGSAAATNYASYAPADAPASRPAPQAARSADPSATAPRRPPHARRHRSPRPQSAPHQRIRRGWIMSPTTERLPEPAHLQDSSMSLVDLGEALLPIQDDAAARPKPPLCRDFKPSAGLEPATPPLPWPRFEGEFSGAIPHEYWAFGPLRVVTTVRIISSQIAVSDRPNWHDCQLKLAVHEADDLRG